MVSRLKHDKVLYDQRKFDFEKEFNQMIKAKQLFEADNTNNHE